MKKQLNVEQIQSELRGGSAFFPGYKGGGSPTPPSKPTENTTTGDNSRTPSPPVPPVRVVPPVPLVPPKKRVMKQRHPFDIYHDQYDALKQLALEERMQGGIGSMNAMVRQAIDTFIAAKRRVKK